MDFLWRGIKYKCNAPSWYTVEYPTYHLYLVYTLASRFVFMYQKIFSWNTLTSRFVCIPRKYKCDSWDIQRLNSSQIDELAMGTGAFKVSREGPEEYKHRREASMATRQAGTTQSLRAWRPEVPEGRATRNLRTPIWYTHSPQGSCVYTRKYIPFVICIFRVHTHLKVRVYTEKIQVTRGIFKSILLESIAGN